MPPILVDIGLNLTHDSFDHDRDALLARGAAAGIEYMIITGSSLASTQAAIDLAQQHPDRMRATAGIHPHHAAAFPLDQISALRDLLLRPEVVAAGECGLDYFRNFSPHADQERVFRTQLELACEVHKPLFLHQRDAHAPFVEILKDYLPRIAGGVAHCFTGNMTEARHYLDLGLYIGVTGWICDERRGQSLRDVVKHIPLDRMLIETDAPYLLPRDLKPKPASRRNEPMYLAHVLHTIAEARGENVDDLAAATTRNATALFGWPPARSVSR
jgi:TatD DNase family protein